MKKRLISIYFIALLVLSNLFAPTAAHAQEIKILNDDKQDEQPFYQGLMVGVDVFGLMSKALGSDATSSEIGVQANLMNRFFPVVEIGYGKMDITGEETDIHYRTSAPYFRVGADYNIFYKKPHLPGYFTVGLRYGFSSFTYDMQSPDLVDPNWGHTSIPVSYEGVKSNAGWLEVVLGLKTNVFKDFYMGLTVRYRSRMSLKKHENSEPYYIPGYGRGKSSNFGITYNLSYRLPF